KEAPRQEPHGQRTTADGHRPRQRVRHRHRPGHRGDPVANGATLRVIAKGHTPSDQTYLLDAAGWRAAGRVGFKYAGPTGVDGDPVKKLLIKRTPGGTALVKAILKGSVGKQSLDVVPPNRGDEGGIILTINRGGTFARYCCTSAERGAMRAASSSCFMASA